MSKSISLMYSQKRKNELVTAWGNSQTETSNALVKAESSSDLGLTCEEGSRDRF
jgi:hypothetical protein